MNAQFGDHTSVDHWYRSDAWPYERLECSRRGSSNGSPQFTLNPQALGEGSGRIPCRCGPRRQTATISSAVIEIQAFDLDGIPEHLRHGSHGQVLVKDGVESDRFGLFVGVDAALPPEP
jgi:hypothetical protein